MTTPEKIKLFKLIANKTGASLNLTESQFNSPEFIQVADRFILNIEKLFKLTENMFNKEMYQEWLNQKQETELKK